MSSKREEEKNEKIIRGLMKLPPNRRCINCNSLGPQYVCTNFWTFVCITCSGIHREFTHRVKSVSMAKFTSQEVDALQKGGNQRARELFLMAWDPQRQRLPDNSNADKVRDFIKNVYVDKRYAVVKSSERPPRDPQSHEDDTRRASSYHSYSQSPPYDFQYEERRYGKHPPSLTRKPGSDRGLYEGKLSSFLSPSRLSFANEGSYPRASDYSVSSGSDPFRSDVSQREIGSPFSETSSNFSSEITGHNAGLHNSDGNDGGRIRHPQRTTSSGSFGSFDSMSFKSANSVGLQEVASEPEQSVATSLDKTSSLPSLLPQSSTSTAFNGLDLFSEPFAPQNVTSIPSSSVATFNEQQPSKTHFDGKTSETVMAHSGGWATFDVPQNLVSVGTENSIPATVPSCDGNNPGNFNPFSLDQSSSNQNSAYHEPSASTHALWHDGPQNVETTTSNAPFWNAFEDYPGQQPTTQNVVKNSDQAAVLHASDASKFHGFGIYKVDENVRTPEKMEPTSSNLSSHVSMGVHDFSTAPVLAGVHSLATKLKPTNPFDLPFDSDLESNNMTQFWDMNSLQAALPNNHTPALYMGNANESWFPHNSVATYAPGGATFDPPSAGSFGFIVGLAPSTQISTVPQGPVAIGGNPFA